jgi:hypothetical protein
VATPAAFPNPPPRDLTDLQRRLRPNVATSSTPAAASDPAVGSEETFWVANQIDKTYFQANAGLVLKTDHVLWYVEDGVALAPAQVQQAATYFESDTYPTEQKLFFESWPGLSTGDRLTILAAKVPGVGGYFSNADEYPTSVNPYSNQREMIYINVDSVRPGTSAFNSTVAHEFQHLVQFHVHPRQNSWINEGAAELAAQAVTGSISAGTRPFERAPQTQLNGWASEPSASLPHYGAAYLFMRYVAEHFGGFQAVGKVVAEPGRSIAAFQEFFAQQQPKRTFDDVFADWVAANYLNDPSLSDGRYGYNGFQLHPDVETGPDVGKSTSGSAVQFGTTYYRISTSQPATFNFQGGTSVPYVGAEPTGTPDEWWSNRGDSIDSTLTRPVDLTSLSAASLSFSAWYDAERDFDYAYAEISTDNGATWTTLATKDTTKTNPNGQNYGNGFTGTSGGTTPGWVHETADLRPFVGKKVLLRFEYVTDDSYNGDGFVLDNVEIPEAGFRDDVSTDNGWQANGFVRIANQEPETYLVEVLDPKGTPPARTVRIGPDGRGSVAIDANHPVVIAVAGLATRTTHSVAYTIGLAAR